MNLFDKISYKENILLRDNLSFRDQKQILYIVKYFCDTDVYDRYYLKINSLYNHEMINQGYLYFYLDAKERKSSFVGMNVFKEYRDCGIASLLLSSWIQLCLDEGFLNLETTEKQRKPFLLYLLKKYAFELENLNAYQISPRIVHICRKENDMDKYIMFENKFEERNFRNSNVMKADNYKIISREEKAIQIIDSVVLNSKYFLQNPEKAYQKSLQIYRKYS